jgi:hypothetical protein
MYNLRPYAAAGGLISYNADIVDIWRRVATYVDRILKGAMSADLPVEQLTKLFLMINLKTAKALGLTIPQSLLQRADEVIQQPTGARDHHSPSRRLASSWRAVPRCGTGRLHELALLIPRRGHQRRNRVDLHALGM